ncbi:MAG TPA: IS21 family transposase [Burkholderiales bacterium]|nr:IS21 family transposase [Burkholderiales bacterium]
MIDAETVARIRHLHHAEGWRVGTIAAQLGLHHETVERALKEHAPPEPSARASGLDPYLEFTRETLERYPRLTSTRLWQMLRARGCTLSPRQVRRKVAQLRPRPREAFLRRRTFPGEEAQVDWASFGHVMVGTARRALSAFVMVLVWSRLIFLRFFLDQTLESFLRGHVEAFTLFGGVPRVCLYDNLKAAVLARHAEAVRFNPRLLELCAHYHFVPRACRVARGNEKGGVERAIRYVRDSFFAARSFASVADLNRQAREWCEEVSQPRRWPADQRRSVAEAFAEEAPRLLPLPAHPFETDLVVAVHARKTIYLRFDLNDYSIPPSAVGRDLTLVASEHSLRVLDGTAEIAAHRRSYDRQQRIEDAAHIDALLREKQRARGSTPAARLIAAVPAAEAFLEAAFERGESVAVLTEKLLQLLDEYGAGELRTVVDEALARDTPRLSSVSFLLGRRRRAAKTRPPLPVDLSRRPDLKDLYVKPHLAEIYDELSRNDDDDQD